MKKISLIEIKQALKDSRFREILPEEIQEDVTKYLSNPGCPCNLPLYRFILKNCKEQIKKYFPNSEIEEVKEEAAENHWTVISCSIDDLEKELRMLPKGRKQLSMSRFEDQVTVIVNELDLHF